MSDDRISRPEYDPLGGEKTNEFKEWLREVAGKVEEHILEDRDRYFEKLYLEDLTPYEAAMRHFFN